MMHHVYKSHEKSSYHQALDALLINQIIALTILHASQIITNHKAAFLSVFNPASYHLLSHQDVSILNQA